MPRREVELVNCYLSEHLSSRRLSLDHQDLHSLSVNRIRLPLSSLCPNPVLRLDVKRHVLLLLVIQLANVRSGM